ncbi:50S ribosomal protein L29 [Candidatus Dependentiae bacterium]
MKLAKEREQLKGLSEKELKEKVIEFKRELFSIRLNSMTAHVKDYSRFKKLRKSVARALTCLSEKVHRSNS